MLLFYNWTTVLAAWAAMVAILIPWLGAAHRMKNALGLHSSGVAALGATACIVVVSWLYFIGRMFLIEKIWIATIVWAFHSILLAWLIRRHSSEGFRFQDLVPSADLIRKGLVVVGILTVYFVVLAPYLWRNGYDGEGNLHAYDMFASEGLWHANMVTAVRHTFPPETMNAHATSMAGYHYFPDMFIALMMDLTSCNESFILFLYFFVPFCLCLLAVNVHALTKQLTGSFFAACLAMTLSLFFFDFTAVILWLRGVFADGSAWFGSNLPTHLSAWSPILTQFQLFHNPSYLFSSALVFGVLLFSERFCENRHTRFGVIFWLVALMWVFLIKAKITTFFTGIAALAVFGALRSVLRKDHRYLQLTTAVIVLSVPFIWLAGGSGKNSVEFSNWYFPANFAVRSHLISRDVFEQISESGYAKNLFDNVKFVLAFLLYYGGLLHVRLIALQPLWRLKSWIRMPGLEHLLLAFALAGLAAFILVVNGVSKYDSMWFYLVSVFSLNILLARQIAPILVRWKSRRFMASTVVICLALGTMSFVIPSLNARFSNRPILKKEVVQGLRLLRDQPPGPSIMTNRFAVNDSVLGERFQIVGAWTGKRVVSEGVDYDFEYRAKNPDFLRRLDSVRGDIKLFYETTQTEAVTRLIDKYQVGYVLLWDGEALGNPVSGDLELIYRSSALNILKVRP